LQYPRPVGHDAGSHSEPQHEPVIIALLYSKPLALGGGYRVTPPPSFGYEIDHGCSSAAVMTASCKPQHH